MGGGGRHRTVWLYSRHKHREEGAGVVGDVGEIDGLEDIGVLGRGWEA